MPDGVTDRPADVWEPLLAVADAAGGDWPASSPRSLHRIVQGRTCPVRRVLGVRLLADLRDRVRRPDDARPPSSSNSCTRSTRHRGPTWGKPLDARGLAAA